MTIRAKTYSFLALLVLIGLGILLLSRGSGGDSFDELVKSDPLLQLNSVHSIDGLGLLPEDVPQPDAKAIQQFEQNPGFTTKQFSDAYEKSLETQDHYLKQHLAETLYLQTKDQNLLPTLITLSLERHDLKKAMGYMLQADIHDESLYEILGIEKTLYILMNATQLERSNVDALKQIVKKYFMKGIINETQKNFYYSFIALAKGDFENHQYFLNELVGTSYQQRAEKFTVAQQKAGQYEYTPDRYAHGLYGVELFYAGWYNYAQYIGEFLVEKDPQYILGYQLRAYAHLMLGEWQQASEMLEYIKQQDDNELFVLLQAIALYHGEVYSESVLLLQGISDTNYKLDAQRYLLLSYKKLGDRAGMFATMRNMVGYEMTPFDYFTMFDYVLFDKLAANMALSERQQLVMDRVMDQCQIDIGKQYGYICLYGKAGLRYVNGEHKKALSLLEGLIQWYPTATVYERIGDIHFGLGNEEKAKKAYIRAFSTGSSSEERAYLRSKIINFMQ